MPFVKLDCGMLNSTIWVDRPAREIFITALLMAEPITYDEPAPQIAVRTLDFTGWNAPPGNYGLVPAAGVGIAARCGMDLELGLCALERLGAPEPDSRSHEHDGRRMIRVDGGYLILNYGRYRDRDYSNATRQKRWRDRQKDGSNGVTPASNAVTLGKVTHADGEADANSRGIQDEEKRPTRATRADTRLSNEFDLSDERRAYAVAENLDPDRTFAQFCDYWRSVSGSRGLKRNWDATWRYWCRNQTERNGHGTGGKVYKPRPSSVERVYAATDAWLIEQQSGSRMEGDD